MFAQAVSWRIVLPSWPRHGKILPPGYHHEPSALGSSLGLVPTGTRFKFLLVTKTNWFQTLESAGTSNNTLTTQTVSNAAAFFPLRTEIPLFFHFTAVGATREIQGSQPHSHPALRGSFQKEEVKELPELFTNGSSSKMTKEQPKASPSKFQIFKMSPRKGNQRSSVWIFLLTSH